MKNVHPRWSRELRRELRQRMTKAEKIFWYKLRLTENELRYIRRQVSMGHFVVDFLHPRSKTIIEIDGVTHSSAEEKLYDASRTEWLQERGYVVLRFSNQEVIHSIEAVFQRITFAIDVRMQTKKRA